MSNPLALIIEDDEDLSMIFSAALQEAGFETETISDGQAALARLADIIPAAVVLDLHLPHVSGEGILEYIRADDRLAETRVIVATADALMAKGLQARANLVLLKPVSFEQLRALSARLRPANGRGSLLTSTLRRK